MLFGCKDDVQAARSNLEDLWYAWLVVYAPRYELHDIRRPDMYYASPCKFTHATAFAFADSLGCNHVSRSRHQSRCSRLFCEAHACSGSLCTILAYARDASPGEQSAPSFLCRHRKALRTQGNLPIWEPSGGSSIKSSEQPGLLPAPPPKPSFAIGTTRSDQLPCPPHHSTNIGVRPGFEN